METSFCRFQNEPSSAFSYYCAHDEFPGVETVWARNFTHRFPNHSHPYAALGVLREGKKIFDAGGRLFSIEPGEVFYVPEGVVHASYSPLEGGSSYDALYIPTHLLVALTGKQHLPLQNGHQVHVWRDEGLALGLGRFHESLGNNSPPIFKELALYRVVEGLFQRLGHRISAERSSPPAAALLMRDYIHDNHLKSISLEDLALKSRLSRFHAAHVFKKAFGISPHAYLDQVRLHRAIQLIARGNPIAEVAFELGFSDQSHLTRRLKRLTGFTPGQINNSRKNVQDSFPKLGLRLGEIGKENKNAKDT